MVPWNENEAAAILEPFADASMVLVSLQALQERFGHVPPDAVALVARACNVSRADVHGVLTFYHDLHSVPPARRQVRICRAEACQSVGSRAIEDGFAAAGYPVGSHSDEVSIEAVYCFGNCALGPNVEIDGALHGRCDHEIVAEALR